MKYTDAVTIDQHPVLKLVIWDLDGTFWSGTLLEGSATPIDANIAFVKLLASRGIISSICSHNDAQIAKAFLSSIGVWEYFVHPAISWSSKGGMVRKILDDLHLRPENACFIDNEPANLAEVQHQLMGIRCYASPKELVESFAVNLSHYSFDPELKRLGHYRELAVRASSWDSRVSNIDFLRQSRISVEIDYDVEPQLERVVELLNRANQLNFTKKRIRNVKDREELESQLVSFGFKAGIVRVQDRYSNYGISGFFMTLATLREYCYVHFVFSCRILNLGVEQYVHDLLNRPRLDIQEPVSSHLRDYERIDWIGDSESDRKISPLREGKTLLLGGCDMLQLGTYCSNNSVEFTNRLKGEWIYRFDDPNFIMGDYDSVVASPIREKVPIWNATELADFRSHLAVADLVVLSIYDMMTVTYFRGSDGLAVRFHEDSLRDLLKSDLGIWFVRNFSHIYYDFEERLKLVGLSIYEISIRSKPEANIVVITENVRKMEDNCDEAQRRSLYNDFLKDLTLKIPKLRVIDVNEVTRPDWLIDGWHMSRQAYFELAEHIKEVIDDTRASKSGGVNCLDSTEQFSDESLGYD